MEPEKKPDVEWKCPKCGALPNHHGEGECRDDLGRISCGGFLCDCAYDDGGDGDDADHGMSYAKPCKNACCYHCGWGGVFPKKPAGLAKWEKQALDAGWTMSAKRLGELQAAEAQAKLAKKNKK